MTEVEEFLAKGGSIKRCKPGANSGITTKEWQRRVRGEKPPVEMERTPARQTLHLRAGWGSK